MILTIQNERRKVMKPFRVIIVVVFIAFIAMTTVLVPCESWAASKKLLAMGATQSSSSHFAYFVAIAKIMNTQGARSECLGGGNGRLCGQHQPDQQRGSRFGDDDDPSPVSSQPGLGRLERQTRQRPVRSLGLSAGATELRHPGRQRCEDGLRSERQSLQSRNEGVGDREHGGEHLRMRWE